MIEDGVEIGSATWLITTDSNATVRVGARTFISAHCVIAARERVEIGPDSMIAELVTIRDHDHDPDFPPRSGRMLSDPISIGARVWIGTKATIARGVSVGDDAVIGANAVVTHDVQAATIVGGVPARLIRSKPSQHGNVPEQRA